MIPADADLTARSEGITAWDDVDDAQKPILARQMEVYAGFLEYADHHTGRAHRRPRGARDPRRHADLLHHRRQRRLGRGRPRRRFMITTASNGGGEYETVEFWNEHLDELGGPHAYNHYAFGWAHAHVHAVPVDQAGRLALRRNAQRHDRALAGEDHRQGRDPPPVAPRHRRRADDPRAGRHRRSRTPSTASPRSRCRASRWRTRFNDADADERHHDPVLRADGQPRDLPRRVDRA